MFSSLGLGGGKGKGGGGLNYSNMGYYREFSIQGALLQQRYMWKECLSVMSLRTVIVCALPYLFLIAIFLGGIASPAKERIEVDREVVRNTRFLGNDGIFAGVSNNIDLTGPAVAGGLPPAAAFFASPTGATTAGLATGAGAAGVAWYSSQPNLDTSCSVYAATACNGKWAKPVPASSGMPAAVGAGNVSFLTRFRAETCGATCQKSGLFSGHCQCTRTAGRI
jgi:hypothetical protein